MQTNQQIVTRFITEFLGRGDLAAADATASPTIQGITGLKPTGPINGLEEYKQTIRVFVDAFPADAPLHILDQFVSEDGTRVVTRFQSRQRHTKEFFGVKASGLVLVFDETHVATVTDGKIVTNVVSATNLEFEMLLADALRPLVLPALYGNPA